MEEYSFNELISKLKNKYRKDSDFTDYCVEVDCIAVVSRFGMFCVKHQKGD